MSATPPDEKHALRDGLLGKNDRANQELAEIRRFYDNVYYENVASEPGPTWHQRRLAQRLNIGAAERVLDVGCGLGGWLTAAAERGAAVAGIDLSEKAIEACRNHLPTGDFHCGPAERLPFVDCSFDVVTCLGSLEHFVDPVAALTEMARVAKDNAKVVLLVPNSGFLTRRLGLYRGTHQIDAKEEVRSIGQWEALFRQSELVVVDRWRDLHVVSWRWIMRFGWWRAAPRLAQAAALPFWPLQWQYQIYFDCRRLTPWATRL